MRQIYTRLTLNPEVFKKTVLIITYDEHGGIHDHWKPPTAVPPESGLAKFRARRFTRRLITWLVNFGNNYGFGRLGMRVPTVIVSPWMPPVTSTTPSTIMRASLLRCVDCGHRRNGHCPTATRRRSTFGICSPTPTRPPTSRTHCQWTDSGAFAAPIGRALVCRSRHR